MAGAEGAAELVAAAGAAAAAVAAAGCGGWWGFQEGGRDGECVAAGVGVVKEQLKDNQSNQLKKVVCLTETAVHGHVNMNAVCVHQGGLNACR